MRAARTVGRHIIHFAVAAGIQPRQQAGFRITGVDAADTDRIKAQLAPPAPNVRLQFCSILMHAANLTLALPDEAATLELGAALAAAVPPGTVIWLEGDLGAGKTTLVRGLLRGAGDNGPVKSPTYTLVEVHPVSGLNFYHFDFYRFNQPEEYLDAGLDEYFSADAICLVEWPDRAGSYAPAPDLQIRLHTDGAGRSAELVASSARGMQCLTGVTSSGLPPPA